MASNEPGVRAQPALRLVETELSSGPGDVRTFSSPTFAGTRVHPGDGDEAAAELAATFADLARSVVSACGGDVIELRGDEALCVFGSARQALRAAVELQCRFRIDGQPSFPLGIGIGLDAGEAVALEGGYRGSALNLASRLCALAAPGQILATETVVSLARRVGGFVFPSGDPFVSRASTSPYGQAKSRIAIQHLPTG